MVVVLVAVFRENIRPAQTTRFHRLIRIERNRATRSINLDVHLKNKYPKRLCVALKILEHNITVIGRCIATD